MHRRHTLLFAASGCIIATAPAQQLDTQSVFEQRNLGPVIEVLGRGEYDLCARVCEAAIKRGMKAPEWRIIRARSLMSLGQEATARDELDLAVKTYPDNLQLLILQHENALLLGRKDLSDQALAAVNQAAKNKPGKDRSAQDWVSLGQAALALGADAKKVSEQYFQTAQKKEPALEIGYLAEGRLALQKNDPSRAANIYRAGLKAHGESADLRAGLARAFANGDREKQQENLTRALELNPRHSQALQDVAEQLIFSEKFQEADATLEKIFEFQKNCPEAWAMRAAIQHVSHAKPEDISASRAKGLERWPNNPSVDHTLGRLISRAYRFAEGARHQRQALTFDPLYLPAQIQLCHDLLRLGQEDEAWQLAAKIREQDGYNVQAHNIGLLEKQMGGYITQSYPDFIIKMPRREWPIYGMRALALLREAKAALGPKYGFQQSRPIIVEFFDSQQDFAIRTFGSLGGQGLLGVCFGTVITMNSPGSLAQGRNNWEATLWHEFCHVVTLSVTHNKMPRWLSEGISVYEEGQQNPMWGMQMDARFRKLILEEDAATPLSQLSSAFFKAKDHDATMLAYYQSSLVVRYLIQRFGQESLHNILKDLADGKNINAAITAHTEPMEALEADFASHLKKTASDFGALADWSTPDPEALNPLDPESLKDYHKKHPTNLFALRRIMQAQKDQGDWAALLSKAEELIRLTPEDTSSKSGYQIKAEALGKLQRQDEELATLRFIAEKESGALPTFLRLMEEDSSRQDWAAMQVNAERVIAINPFLRSPHSALAIAAEAQQQTEPAIQAYRRVLILDTAGNSHAHYRLAHLLRPTDKTQAKRHLLDSLTLAPRFREGYELLRTWE